MAAILPLAHPFGFANELFPAKKNILKIGLIGCGGRGTGAAAQALRADPDVELVAMGDIFEDQVATAYDALMKIEPRSEEHTSELQSLMRISYAVFCLKKKKN